MNANDLELFNEQSIIAKLKTKLARQRAAIAETEQHIAAIEALRKTRENAAAQPQTANHPTPSKK